MFELLGPTVDAVVGDLHQGGDDLEPNTILRISKQLLQAVTFMHEVGYIHGGNSGIQFIAIKPDAYGRSVFVQVSLTDLCRFKWQECCLYLQWVVTVDRRGALRSPWCPGIGGIVSTGW